MWRFALKRLRHAWFDAFFGYFDILIFSHNKKYILNIYYLN